ncbi:MAG: serine/threonine protein kinase [Gammaproteobacteria bacterium]|nr:serine/threonine protein kinase [Gammaproteobacteria bacterium]
MTKKDLIITADQNTPFVNLNPSLILDAVESVGLRCTGSLFSLNSYENRVYQIGIEESDPIIAKFYRPHRWADASILEEHQFSAELVQYEIPVIAPLMIADQTLHHYQDYRFALFKRLGGRPLELDNLDQLEWMGRFIGRLHAVGAITPFKHRTRLDAQTHGYIPYQFLMNHHFIPDYLQANYSNVVESVLEKVVECFKLVGPIDYIRVHGDCHAGNVLWNETGPRIVDLDDSLMAPAIQDIWMLLSGNTQQVKQELDRILDGYCEFHDLNFRELHLVEAFRSLRMVQYSAWLANRWNDPAFPPSFPWFNTPRYWQTQLQDLSEQLDLLDGAIEKLS